MTCPEAVPNEALEISLCGPEERAEQAGLFNGCFKKSVDAAALAWRYDKNPHGTSVSLVSRPPGGRGVSGYACSPRLALPAGDETQAALIGQTGDVCTDPKWRKRGIFSGLDARCMEETGKLGWPVVFGLPNRHSAHIFLELGWERVGSLRTWTLFLEGGREARALFMGEGRLKSWLAPLGVRAWLLAKIRLRKEAAGRFGVRGLKLFPKTCEDLSRAVEADFALMVRRDAAYLNWRFMENPSGLHRALGVYDRENRFAGYAVVQLPSRVGGVGYLVDLLAPDAAARATLLEGAMASLTTAGATLVRATAVDGSWWNEILRSVGFQPPQKSHYLSVILYTHDASHPLARAARDPSRWYLTDGDRDDETMG